MLEVLQRVTRYRGRIALVLVAGVVAGLVVGGALRGLGGRDHGNAAEAAGPAATTEPKSTPAPAPPVPTTAPLKQGSVVADAGAGDLTSEIALGRTRTSEGAVAAFTAYATWLVGSPAAAAEPEKAAGVVGGRLIDPTDARLLAGMQRGKDDGFDAEHGAYRVLGHAGAAKAPDEVMIEVTAPLTLGERTQWRTIGGVVGWTPQGWQLVSIKPGDVPQPAADRKDVRRFTVQERARTLDGLGWHAFRLSSGR